MCVLILGMARTKKDRELEKLDRKRHRLLAQMKAQQMEDEQAEEAEKNQPTETGLIWMKHTKHLDETYILKKG